MCRIMSGKDIVFEMCVKTFHHQVKPLKTHVQLQQIQFQINQSVIKCWTSIQCGSSLPNDWQSFSGSRVSPQIEAVTAARVQL